MTSHILFPLGGPRLTTILALSILLTLAIARGDKKPALACLAWLLGYEAAFETADLLIRNGGPPGPIHALTYIIVGPILVAWAWKRGIRPEPRLLAAALTVMAIWILTGFHVNLNAQGMHGFQPAAEVLNETSKMLWALAYLIPVLITKPRRRSGGPEWPETRPSSGSFAPN